MTCSSPLRQEHANLTVLDVYDEAALIGKDFERIIEGNCFLFSIRFFIYENSLWNGNYS
jgi:hypothetical protein